jgi:hypothetical protein
MQSGAAHPAPDDPAPQFGILPDLPLLPDLTGEPPAPGDDISSIGPDFAMPPAEPDPSILDGHVAHLEAQLHRLHAHVSRLDAQLESDPALLPTYIRLLNLQGQLTSRLAHLIRDRQLIGEADHQDMMNGVMNEALDGVSKIFNVDL